jgi:ribosome-binding factor A
MTNSRIRDIKHAQKESLLLQTIGQFFVQIQQDQPELQKLSISRVQLSPEKGSCTVYFYALGGIQEYEALRSLLVLYKPSLRKAVAQEIRGRYTPEIRFKYDEKSEKQRRVDDLIETLKREGKL